MLIELCYLSYPRALSEVFFLCLQRAGTHGGRKAEGFKTNVATAAIKALIPARLVVPLERLCNSNRRLGLFFRRLFPEKALIYIGVVMFGSRNAKVIVPPFVRKDYCCVVLLLIPARHAFRADTSCSQASYIYSIIFIPVCLSFVIAIAAPLLRSGKLRLSL